MKHFLRSWVIVCLFTFLNVNSCYSKEKQATALHASENKTEKSKPPITKPVELSSPIKSNETRNTNKEKTDDNPKDKEIKEVKALTDDAELEIESLINANKTSAKNSSESTSKQNPKKETKKVVSKQEKQKQLKIIDEKIKENEDSGSGTESFVSTSTTESSNANVVNSNTKASSEDEKSHKDSKESKEKEEYSEEYDPNESNETNDSNEFGYNNEDYYGAEGQGYEYNNNNGEQSGKTYSYGFNNNVNNPPIIVGDSQNNQNYDMKTQADTSVTDTPQGSFDPYQALDMPSQDGTTSDSMAPSQDMTSNAGQGIGSLGTDEDGVATEYGDYEKKTKTNKVGKKRTKLHKKFNSLHHKHNIMKARKLVTTLKRSFVGKTYKRTIMIGNRVCGSKKSTNVHSLVKKDEIHMARAEETSIKKEQPSVIRATDQCCAEHYECPRIVPAKSNKYGYQNDIEYDVMGCSCDTKFRNCLKNANSYTADAVGHLYFNTLKIPCLTFEQETPDVKSEQPNQPQESMNVVSVVPDAETERETVGGAQLVVAPRNLRKENNNEREKQANIKPPKKENIEDHQQDRQEQQQDLQPSVAFQQTQQQQQQPQQQSPPSQVQATANRAKEIQKEEEEEEDALELRKNKRPDTINPNPSPSNPNPYGGKLRGVVNIPEAYLPKISVNH